MALQDTLKGLKQEAEKAKELKQEIPKEIDKWKSAVDQLLSDISQWLSSYEEQHLLTIEKGILQISENFPEGIPNEQYNISKINLKTQVLTIAIEPMARFIFGARGRVDMFVRGKEERRVTLLRTTSPEENKEKWVIFFPIKKETFLGRLSPPTLPNNRVYEPLDKERFEKAVDYLLSNKNMVGR